MRDLENTTKKVVCLTEQRLKNRNTDDGKFFSEAIELMEKYKQI